jgi:hypothetical protein
VVESLPPGPAGRRWIIEPLIDVGLGLGEVNALLFRIAFDAMVGHADIDMSVRNIVADQPAPVQAAWIETVTRMIGSSRDDRLIG